MSKKRKRFASYYNTYFEKIYRYIFFRVGQNRETAEDLTSEVMLKAYEAFEDFDQERNFKVWIYRIARNHLIDHYKKTKKNIVDLEDAEYELKFDDKLEEKAETKMKMEHVEQAIERLPEQHKEVITLKFMSEMTNKEIAEILNLKETHVRVLVNRATGGLKKQLSFLT